MLIERFQEESSTPMRECYICKIVKNFLHFTFIHTSNPLTWDNHRDDICLECISKVPKHIPEVQIEKYLEERYYKKRENKILEG